MGAFSFADLQQVAKEAGFDLVPDGDYEAVVESGVKVVKSANGKDMFKLAFKITQGPVKGKVFTQLVISPESANALAFFFRHMKALGFDDEYFKTNPPMAKVAKDLEGRRAKITVGTRKWNEQDRNEVTGIKPSAFGPTGGNNGMMNGAPIMASPTASAAGVPNITLPPVISATPDSASAPAQAPAQASAPPAQTAQGPSQALPDDPF